MSIRDIPWLNSKLEDSWGSYKLSSRITKEVLDKAIEGFDSLDSSVKINLLFATITLRKSLQKEYREEIQQLFSLAQNHHEEWVSVTAILLESFSETQGLLAHEPSQNCIEALQSKVNEKPLLAFFPQERPFMSRSLLDPDTVKAPENPHFKIKKRTERKQPLLPAAKQTKAQPVKTAAPTEPKGPLRLSYLTQMSGGRKIEAKTPPVSPGGLFAPKQRPTAAQPPKRREPLPYLHQSTPIIEATKSDGGKVIDEKAMKAQIEQATVERSDTRKRKRAQFEKKLNKSLAEKRVAKEKFVPMPRGGIPPGMHLSPGLLPPGLMSPLTPSIVGPDHLSGTPGLAPGLLPPGFLPPPGTPGLAPGLGGLLPPPGTPGLPGGLLKPGTPGLALPPGFNPSDLRGGLPPGLANLSLGLGFPPGAGLTPGGLLKPPPGLGLPPPGAGLSSGGLLSSSELRPPPGTPGLGAPGFPPLSGLGLPAGLSTPPATGLPQGKPPLGLGPSTMLPSSSLTSSSGFPMPSPQGGLALPPSMTGGSGLGLPAGMLLPQPGAARLGPPLGHNPAWPPAPWDKKPEAGGT